MSEIDGSKCQQLCEEMLAEIDTERIKEKAELLEPAMFVRSMQHQNNPDGQEELARIRKAAISPRKVQVEKLGFPGSIVGIHIGKSSSGQQ